MSQPTGSEQESFWSSGGNYLRNEQRHDKTGRTASKKNVLKRYREAKGWSQQVLAEKAIVCIKTLSSLEQGNPALLSTFGKIAKALGVEPGELIEGHGPDPSPNSSAAVPTENLAAIKLTLSIPFQYFNEMVDVGRVEAFLMAVINSKNAIVITDVSPGSVKLTMLVDEDDVPRLLQAFVDRKLDQIQASELTVPRKGTLFYGAALATPGTVNPVIVPAPPFGAVYPAIMSAPRFVAFKLGGNRSQQSSFDDDFQTLERNPQATTPISYNSIPIVAVGDPSSIQQAIEDIIPQYLIPRFPGSITLRLEPDEDGTDSSITLGERLESLLSSHESLRSKMRRAHTTPDWSGDITITITLDTVDELRAMSEELIVGFLGQPVTLAVSGTCLGGQVTLKTSLSGPEWNSIIEELAELHKRKLKSINLGLTPPPATKEG